MKKKALADVVAERVKESHPPNWLDRLDAKQRKEVLDLLGKVAKGEIEASQRILVESINETYGPNTVKRYGVADVIAKLKSG